MSLKDEKIEQNKKYKERHYNIKKSEDTKNTQLKTKWNNKFFLNLNIAYERKPYNGVNGIFSHNHI